MSKIEKKVRKLVNQGKYLESYKAIEKELAQKKPTDYAEEFLLFSIILEQLNQTHEQLIHDILYYVEKNLDNPDWIIRRNALLIIGVLAKRFPSIFIARKYFSSLKKTTSIDQHWEVRSAAFTVYGVMGEYDPERVLPFLSESLKDEDSDVRLTIIRHLYSILEKNHTFIPNILPLLKKIQDSDVHWEVSKYAQNVIESLSSIQKPIKTPPPIPQEIFLCPFCGHTYTQVSEMCLHCGKAFPRCMICKEIIRMQEGSEIAYCPHCKALAHPEHLINWLLVKNSCPACMNALHEHEIKLISKKKN
jgi:hypothetical protein